MANLRILYDNVADDVATLGASSTAGSLAASNLLTDYKSEVHRSTATSVTYTLTWSSPVTLSMAALAFANLTSTATMRARLYTNTTDSSPALDTGAALCCAYQRLGSWPWGVLPLGVNAFSYGGGAYGRLYFAATSCKKLVIDVADVDNTQGYIEAARIITGAYWSPEFNPGYGAQLSPKSNTQHKRTDAGDLRTETRPTSRELTLDMSLIRTASDRARLYDILRGNGMSRPVWLSLYPEHADTELEQSHQIWGKLDDSAMTNFSFGAFSAPLRIQEI